MWDNLAWPEILEILRRVQNRELKYDIAFNAEPREDTNDSEDALECAMYCVAAKPQQAPCDQLVLVIEGLHQRLNERWDGWNIDEEPLLRGL